MDWSLLQPNCSKRLLRDVRGYKNPLWYYLAMFLDPILRFNWIFYAIYTTDLGHSSIVSFLVAFSEVTRRGIWVIFRVENEHCANVARFKASRDVPLPYALTSESDEDATRLPSQEGGEESEPDSPTATSPALSRAHTRDNAQLEAQISHTDSNTLRRRRSERSGTFTGMGRAFTKVLADAHTQDFEKKRKSGNGEDRKGMLGGEVDESSDEGSDGEDVTDREEREGEERSRKDMGEVEGLRRGADRGEGSEGSSS